MSAKKKEQTTQEFIKSGANEAEREKRAAGKFVFTGDDGQEYAITLRQKLFCEFYLKFRGDGVDAVIEAGYNPKNSLVASAIAYENLTKPHICAYLNTLMTKSGLTDSLVEMKHLFLIDQTANLPAMAKGIDMFYKVKNKYPAERVIDETAREQLEEMRKDIKAWIGAK